MRVGLISDTHDLMRPEAIDALRGCDHLIHAGDICSPEVLEALSALAPHTVVRGNNDAGLWAKAVPASAVVALEGARILVIHDVGDLRGAVPKDVDVVVSGHSHKPLILERGGVRFVNPGSAGPRRFTLPIAVADLVIEEGNVSPRIIELTVAPKVVSRN